jgi:LacI family transcriptional regulator
MEKNPKKKVTQHDVARHAGVTRSMVSYVLNGNGRSVATETRRKILDVINELGYRPNKFAQALSMGDKGVSANRHIGIVLSSDEIFLRPYYTEILAGIHSKAHERGYHIRFIRFFNELKDPVLFNQLIHSEEICGLLMVAVDQCVKTSGDLELIKKIQSQIDQIVCVDWQLPGLSSVLFDRQSAAFQATSYLFTKGYRDIAYIGESDQRITGFKQAFIEHGENDVSGLYIDDAGDMASGYTAAKKLRLKNGTMPRAIFAGSDEVALGILLYLNEQGIAVPDMTAVISIDNIEVAEYTNPQLTTINVQKRAMGCRAVEMIINQNADYGENALTLLLPTNLMIRKSA